MSSLRVHVIRVTILSLGTTFDNWTAMASSFEVGDTFRNRLTTLLGNSDFSFPKELREELNGVVENQDQATISFRTLRKLKSCLRNNGKLCCVIFTDHGLYVTV